MQSSLDDLCTCTDVLLLPLVPFLVATHMSFSLRPHPQDLKARHMDVYYSSNDVCLEASDKTLQSL